MFGAIGSGGMILLIIVALFIYKKGGGKLQPVKDHHVIYWGAALGLLAASAGTALAQIGTVSTSISDSLNAQSGTVGPVGAGAVALILILIGFGTKPAMTKDLIVGVALPGALSTAGGLLAIPVTVLASVLHGFGA
ncbi:hypothetical protein PUR71_00890 [Streptomyces sp. SP17BM10]|uniref:hypothetical protein n=1 Tax=Streptomyces sp. SP17BM10 TaxID=3002530 RepID=UPI002E782784|nr:hypothetical protein [Streptomyces sp. SP17BM10]MEE1781502.1 hypothetical protein [Streptomyces sp. SP17BM10]